MPMTYATWLPHIATAGHAASRNSRTGLAQKDQRNIDGFLQIPRLPRGGDHGVRHKWSRINPAPPTNIKWDSLYTLLRCACVSPSARAHFEQLIGPQAEHHTSETYAEYNHIGHDIHPLNGQKSLQRSRAKGTRTHEDHLTERAKCLVVMQKRNKREDTAACRND